MGEPRRSTEGCAFHAVITTEEAARNDYNLSPTRYVASNHQEEMLPLEDATVLLEEAEEERAAADQELRRVLQSLGPPATRPRGMTFTKAKRSTASTRQPDQSNGMAMSADIRFSKRDLAQVCLRYPVRGLAFFASVLRGISDRRATLMCWSHLDRGTSPTLVLCAINVNDMRFAAESWLCTPIAM